MSTVPAKDDLRTVMAEAREAAKQKHLVAFISANPGSLPPQAVSDAYYDDIAAAVHLKLIKPLEDRIAELEANQTINVTLSLDTMPAEDVLQQMISDAHAAAINTATALHHKGTKQ